ncbi:hypothetical protein IJG71_01875 [Candidatus Saccharibacteria bacterium]|nr:hypothetical protein [Candidatus Saccharibacteria bacterium]
MDENAGGTPNPLNPNPAPQQGVAPAPTGATTSPATGQVRRPVRRTGPVVGATPRTVRQPRPVAPTPVVEAPRVEPVQPPVEEPEPDPMARSMEAMPTETETKPKKKKTGLIIGILVCVFLAVGCGVAAILLLNNGGDPVAKAFVKAMNGDIPANMNVNGTFVFEPEDATSEVSKIQVALNTDASTTSLINSTTATMTLTTQSAGEQSLDVSEVYGADGDLYLKVNGLAEFITGLSGSSTTTQVLDTPVDCAADDEDCLDLIETETEEVIDTELQTTDTSLQAYSPYLEFIGALDGEWIKLPVDELKSLIGGEATGNDQTQCAMDLFENIKNSSNTIKEFYNQYPFIESTSENITVQSRQNPIYKITFNSENLTGYLGQMRDADFTRKYLTCSGQSLGQIDKDNVEELVEMVPELYVEIDGSYNFTRLYFVTDAEDYGVKVTTDLNFSYPDNINVSEPTEYQNLMDILNNMYTTVYEEESVEVTE